MKKGLLLLGTLALIISFGFLDPDPPVGKGDKTVINIGLQKDPDPPVG
ncbi:hypothetical protein [Aquibacillus kalidii]|nr:hypothetical protein [Aquibacillus kalidii]